MNALDYLLKANLYGLLFASCYWLLLRRHTFFSLNRAYLLSSVILSLILPLVILPAQTVETLPVTMPVGMIALPVSTIVAAPVETGPDWEQLGVWAYALISLVLLIRLSIRVGSLVRLIRRSPRQVHEDYVLIQPNDPKLPTFSFFQYVILNPADVRNELILRHELVHVRQCHSADVLGMGLLQAFFWACPTLWLMDRMLRQVHEFLADKPASQPTEYARFLVAYSFGTQLGVSGPDTLTNSFFNPSLLKQRIIMLQQKATTRWALGKYILVLPLAFGLLAMTTAREEIAAAVSQVTDDTITVAGRITTADGKPLPGAHVIVEGTKTGTETNSKGDYTLSTVSKNASLVFSFVGFEPQVIKVVSGQTVINVRMALQTSKLNEVVVVAYEPASEPLTSTSPKTVKPGSQTSSSGEIFTVVEQVPEFPGGMRALGMYLSKNLRYPTEAQQNKVQGRVFVQFVVSTTGGIRDLRILKGIGSGCDEEAVRVVSQMPKWIPGKQNGKTVAVQYNLPIQFSLEKREDKRTGQVTPTTQPDSERKLVTQSDSNPVVQPDSSKRQSFRLRSFPTQPNLQNSQMRYSLPLKGRLAITSPSLGLPGEKAELFLLNGSKQIDRIEDVNPKDIESIEVDKDPKTIAKYKVLYGDKASKGVVTIHLKSANVL